MGTQAEARLRDLGVSLPEPPRPVATYVPAVRVHDFVYVSGQIPFVDGDLAYRGKVGGDLSLDEGYQAARTCLLNNLAVVRDFIGSIDQIVQIVKLSVFVNSAPGFRDQARVANGASDLLNEVFGDAGRHARTTVACNEAPLDAAVEVDLVVQTAQ